MTNRRNTRPHARGHSGTIGMAVLCIAVLSPRIARGQNEIPRDVMDIFSTSCVQCHAGRNAPLGLDLSSADRVYATAVADSSGERDLLIIRPGDPGRSYLVMKLRNDPSIAGQAMPLTGDRLTTARIETISRWIESLTEVLPGGQSGYRDTGDFQSWVIGNTPTAEIPPRNAGLLFIGHRFMPKLDEGYDSFYGLDGPVVMLLSFGYAVTDALYLSAGRSNAQDLIEIRTRYAPFRSRDLPVSLAVENDLFWNTTPVPGEDRLRSEALSYVLQAIATASLRGGFSLAAAPGLLVNPDYSRDDEDPVVFLDLAGSFSPFRDFSLFFEFQPILSGSRTRSLYSLYHPAKRYDTMSMGVQKRLGGHDFQLFVTNSEGIAAPHQATGGDLNPADGDLRIGFSIFRLLAY